MLQKISKEQVINSALELAKEGYIDVIKLANTYGLDVYATSDHDSFNAYIDYDDNTGKYSIVVNETHPETRRRFSIAHELAHFVLHDDEVKKRGKIHRSNKDSIIYNEQEEKDADQLAAEILMPSELIDSYIKGLSITKDTTFDETIVKELAQKFNVSPLVAILRLRSLEFKVPYLSFA